MDGRDLAIRFSYITNSLHYCGPSDAALHFLHYLETQDNPTEVEQRFKNFEGLYVYLDALAKKAGKYFLDYEVVEAYWIGNHLLDLFTDEDMKDIVRKLTKRGLPLSFAEKLIQNMPSGFVPHHNFNVFYVGVGNTSGKVPTTLQHMDNCRTSWGEVVSIVGNVLHVQMQSLTFQSGKYKLLEEETRTVKYLPIMLPDVKEGDMVAIHWGMAGLVLNKNQLENLVKYHEQIIGIMNSLEPQHRA